MMANSRLSSSLTLAMTAGTSVKPAIFAALKRLSPAMSSYPEEFFLITIGSITPFSIIESDSSLSAASLKVLRG